MKLNYKDINISRKHINIVKSKLESAKDILGGINMPKGYKHMASINNIRANINTVLTNTMKNLNGIDDAVSRFENAEYNNQKAVGDLGKILSKYKIIPSVKTKEGNNTDDDETQVGNSRRKKYIFQFAKSFFDIPDEFKQACPEQGRIEHLDGVGDVYLPYGYDPEDTSTRYNVIYLAHGMYGTADQWLDNETNQVGFKGSVLVDNMIYYGLLEPTIVVCISYDARGNNTNYEPVLDNFKQQAVTVIREYNTYVIPPSASAREVNISRNSMPNHPITYAEDDTDAILSLMSEQRDHFAIAGASQGGILVQEILRDESEGISCSDLFGYYGCFAGYYYDSPVGGEKDVNSVYYTYGMGDESDARNAMPQAYRNATNNPQIINTNLDAFQGQHDWGVWFTSLYNWSQYVFVNPEEE